MRNLSSLIFHPTQISDSEYLGDDDPLKITARFLLEDFEAVTNGMKRPVPEESNDTIDVGNPLFPWKLLTDAVAAFYGHDLKTMMEIVRSFPDDSAVANLKSTFTILAGKPPSTGEDNSFLNNIRIKNRELSEGLEILDEAAAYPELLRKEIGHYVREMSFENMEASKRLYHWAMRLLSEEEPLKEADEMYSFVPGIGEASRICAIVSYQYDPERAVLAWLRSLHSVLEEGKISSEEITARLGIAGRMLRKADHDELLSIEILTNILSYLNFSYPRIKALLPSIKPLPEDSKDIQNWLTGSSKLRIPTDNRKKREIRRVDTSELFLFDEVS